MTRPVTVWQMEEGGIVVKTDDVDVAKTTYAAWLTKEGDLFGTTAEAAAERARYRAGWYRWTPCSPRSCYDHGGHRPGHLQRAHGPRSGVFQAVAVNCD